MVMILLVSVVISVALGQYADAVPIVLIVIITLRWDLFRNTAVKKLWKSLKT